MAVKKTRKRGRPTKYSKAMAARICGHIAEGKSVRSISKLAGMPTTSMIFRWLNDHKDFRDQYVIAKAEQAEHFTEEMVDIADNEALSDLIIDGVPVLDPDTGEPYKVLTNQGVQHARLRIDTRKWLASKLKPKKFGDKVTQEVQPLDSSGEPTEWKVTFVNADPNLERKNEGK